MANFSLRNFRTEINRRGVARPNRFEVTFPLPLGLGPGFSNLTSAETKLVSLFCEVSGLPQQSIGIRNQRIYGPVYPRPFGVDYGGDGLTMTFLLDQQMDVKAFFDAWVSKIIDPVQYFVYYFNTYKTNITITQLDQKDNSPYSVVLEDAFPRNVALLELNSGTQNQAHHLNVTFVYRRWSPIHRITAGVRYPDPQPRELQPDPIFTLFNTAGSQNVNTLPIRNNPDGGPEQTATSVSDRAVTTNPETLSVEGAVAAQAAIAKLAEITATTESLAKNGLVRDEAGRIVDRTGRPVDNGTLERLGYKPPGTLSIPYESGKTIALPSSSTGELKPPYETGNSERPAIGNNPSPHLKAQDATVKNEFSTRTGRYLPKLR